MDFIIENGVLTGYTNPKKVILPSGYKKIGDGFLSENEIIERLVIPEGVEEIGSEAFSYCPNLAYVEIPKTVVKIGLGAFEGTPWLNDQHYKDDDLDYENDNGRYNVYDNNGYLIVGDGLLFKCQSSYLDWLRIPPNVKRICNFAFWDENGDYTFLGTDILYIPHNTYIEDYSLEVDYDEFWDKEYAVVGGKVLVDYQGDKEEFYVPDYVEHIYTVAFLNNTALKRIILNDKLIEIGERAFEGCKNLEFIVIPEKVERIGERAFKDCKNLKKVFFMSDSVYVHESAFEGCDSIDYTNINDSFYKEPEYSDDEILKDYDVSTIIIPAGVKKIGDNVFENCDFIEKVIIPEGIEEIGNEAFFFCENLSNIEIPKSLKNLGKDVFYGTDWTDSWYNLNQKSPEFLIVGDGLLIDFLSNGVEEIEIPKEVKKICSNTFEFCDSLRKIKINDGVEKIESRAFWKCNNLEKINFPSSICEFEKGSFRYTFPSDVDFMGYHFSFDIIHDEDQYKKCDLCYVLELIKNHDFSVDICTTVKYSIVIQMYERSLNSDNSDIENYIKENVVDMAKFFIDTDAYDYIKLILENKKFLSAEIIVELAEYAVEQAQIKKSYDIQLLIEKYKNQHFPSYDFNAVDDLYL